MKKTTLWIAAMVLALAVGARAQGPDFTEVMRELARKLGGQDLFARGEAAKELDALCNQASRPGAESEREAICRAMAANTGSDTPKPARLWLLRQIERYGGAEVVPALVKLMEDDDELVRQHALMALANNRSDIATEKLTEALEEADSHGRVAILNALGYRRDPKAIAAIAK